jgi:hypothetical protein
MAVPIAFCESVMDKWVGSYWNRKNKMEFAIDDVIRGDYEARAQSVQHAVTSGTMTPNEGREILGLVRKDDPKADKLYANSALQPLGEPPEQERISIMGQVAGPTQPTDRPVIVPPATPVASLDQSKPTSVPALPRVASVPPTKPMGGNNPPPKSLKHLHAIKSEMGRGRSMEEIKAFAKRLVEKCPDDLDDVLLSVQMAIAERNQKAK